MRTIDFHGILPIDKESGCTSFSLVAMLRRITKVSKVGHAGTLDPFASGVMLLLLGKEYTKKSASFLNQDKRYRATITLGKISDTYDPEGTILPYSPLVPPLEQVEKTLGDFQGEIEQTPPMYSAKKVGGKKLCDLARRGITIERNPIRVKIFLRLLRYVYPHLEIEVDCSKGTYIRALAHDIGQKLKTGAYLSELERIKSGDFSLNDCIEQKALLQSDFLWVKRIQK